MIELLLPSSFSNNVRHKLKEIVQLYVEMSRSSRIGQVLGKESLNENKTIQISKFHKMNSFFSSKIQSNFIILGFNHFLIF
jgi:hypothetical protein